MAAASDSTGTNKTVLSGYISLKWYTVLLTRRDYVQHSLYGGIVVYNGFYLISSLRCLQIVP